MVKFEKNILRFYIIQTLRALPQLKYYDLILSHGIQSGIVLCLFRRIFRTKAKHIVFEIGSFQSASESGWPLKLMQFASKSINGIIYHSSKQLEYYTKFFPWLVERSQFIKFGTDLEYFEPSQLKKREDADTYILCVGYAKRDWETLIKAYQLLDTPIRLRLVGKIEEKIKEIKGIEQMPYIPINELKDLIHSALFCILPLESHNYAFGQMTLLQQMAMKKLVVVARVPSVVDYVKEGKTALFYSPLDIEDCARVMQDVLNKRYNIQKIGDAARRDLEMFCNEEIMAQNIEDFLNSIMNQ